MTTQQVLDLAKKVVNSIEEVQYIHDQLPATHQVEHVIIKILNYQRTRVCSPDIALAIFGFGQQAEYLKKQFEQIYLRNHPRAVFTEATRGTYKDRPEFNITGLSTQWYMDDDDIANMEPPVPNAPIVP